MNTGSQQPFLPDSHFGWPISCPGYSLPYHQQQRHHLVLCIIISSSETTLKETNLPQSAPEAPAPPYSHNGSQAIQHLLSI